jgi:hypothetical protein
MAVATIILFTGCSIDFSPTPTDHCIIPRGTAVTLDGNVENTEWDDALEQSFQVGDSVVITAKLKHDGSSLLAAFQYEFSGPPNLCFPELLIDVNCDRGSEWMIDDWWFHVSGTDCEAHGEYDVWSDCSVVQPDWWGVPNFEMVENPPPINMFELQIPFSKIGAATGDSIGLALRAEYVSYTYGYWPPGATVESPATWSPVILEP